MSEKEILNKNFDDGLEFICKFNHDCPETKVIDLENAIYEEPNCRDCLLTEFEKEV